MWKALKSIRFSMLARILFFNMIAIAASASATEPQIDPSFVEPIQNVTVTAGRDVKLTCVVDDLGTYKIAWIAYDKSAILTVQEHVITRNPRINVTHDGYRTWTLHIQRVNASDAGVYMCQVNTILAKSQFGFINVVVPPNIIDSESSTDAMVQEGTNVTLVCSATGTPKPSIIWKREDGMKIQINKTHSGMEYIGNDLVLSRISRTDMAPYLCIAKNGVSPTVSKRIQVSVDFPPMMTIPHQLLSAPVGSSVTLECSIEAHPHPLTYWTKGTGETAMLHRSNKYVIQEKTGEVSYRTHMKLTIHKLRESDFGPYKCIAKNSRGDTEGEMKLYESTPITTNSPTKLSYLDKIFKENMINPQKINEFEEQPPPHGRGTYPYIPKKKNLLPFESPEAEKFDRGQGMANLGESEDMKKSDLSNEKGHVMHPFFNSVSRQEFHWKNILLGYLLLTGQLKLLFNNT